MNKIFEDWNEYNEENYPIEKINIDILFPYEKNPFHINKDRDLELLAEDIKEHGLLHPIVVRVLGFGGRYEILSGHRRIEALKTLGISEVEARVYKLTDIEALKVVINSNFFQREKILPSERGKAYMLRNESLKKERYGSVSHCGTQEEKDTQDILAQEFNQSTSSIFRYIRLNYLIDDILALVDNSQIKLTTAVDLSYLSKETQALIYQYYFVEKRDVLDSKKMKAIKTGDNVTRQFLEGLMREAIQEKSEKPLKAVIKKYSGYFKNEQEFVNKIDELLTIYLGQNNDETDT
ncbi:MAG: ParB N-terminal domain-containing protein [Clostridia bacterium]|nr:ParB N-terminal domain-containing protein [Clostridia bacterium]